MQLWKCPSIMTVALLATRFECFRRSEPVIKWSFVGVCLLFFFWGGGGKLKIK